MVTLQLIHRLDSILATSELCGLACTHTHTVSTCKQLLCTSACVHSHNYLITFKKCTLLSLSRWFSVVLYLFFLFVVIVVLLNLLIAQMSNTYSNIQDEAEGTYAVARARILARLEKTRLIGCGEVCPILVCTCMCYHMYMAWSWYHMCMQIV